VGEEPVLETVCAYRDAPQPRAEERDDNCHPSRVEATSRSSHGNPPPDWLNLQLTSLRRHELDARCRLASAPGSRSPLVALHACCTSHHAMPVEQVASLWSWGESNPRPPSGCRPRYDHSRDLRLCGCRTAGSVDLAKEVAAGSFPDVSGLSRRQRSFPPPTTASVAGLR
jgi:hypothetical protein